MRAANITTGIAATLWLCLALVGRQLIIGVVAQRFPGAPNIGQIDFYALWPWLVVTGLFGCAWLCNGLRRWPALLGSVAGVALTALLPYVVAIGGGI